MTIGATLACEIISYLIQIIVFKLSIELLPFIKIVVIETLYNAMLIIIIYPLIEKAGEILFNNNPLSAICAIVCPHENQCRGNCIRGIKKEPVY